MTDPGTSPDPAEPGHQVGLSARTQALLKAIMAVSSNLDLPTVLSRLVEAAAELTGAEYGALGVLGRDGELSQFVTTGIPEEDRARIGRLPRGHGVLGQLIVQPRTLRLADLAAHPSSTGTPPFHPPMRTFLGVPISIRGTVFGNLYLTEKSGGRTFDRQDELLVETLAKAAALVIENARAYGTSERRRHWLEATAELSDALQPPIGTEEALAQVASRARNAAGAYAAAVIQFPAGLHPVISAHDGPGEVDVTALVRRVVDEARMAEQQGVTLEVDLVEQHALVVPLLAHLADPGVLLVVHDHPRSLGDADERELLATFADQAGLAIDRAEAVTDRAVLAVVSERSRIAQDLHDAVIQRLFAIGLRLEGLRGLHPDEESGRLLDGVVHDLDLTIRDIRTTIFGLQDAGTGS